MTKITVDDLRTCGVCPNARKWFERHGLDWRDFVLNGIEVDRARAPGDIQSLLDRLEKAAKAREARDGKE